ncbi:MAG: TetR-like C-terminal domain-containing protein, partial [Christensenellales bacterium]
NKVIHQVAVKHALIMNSNEKFQALNQHIFKPIFNRFGIDEKTEHYMIAYYINGITSIINEWIKNDCKDEISYIEKIIIDCVMPKMAKDYEHQTEN